MSNRLANITANLSSLGFLAPKLWDLGWQNGDLSASVGVQKNGLVGRCIAGERGGGRGMNYELCGLVVGSK